MRLSNGQASLTDWKALYTTAYNGIFIGDLCRTLPQEVDVFKRVRTINLTSHNGRSRRGEGESSLPLELLTGNDCLFICVGVERNDKQLIVRPHVKVHLIAH